MSLSQDFTTTEEAARILGISVQHVRRLAREGDLVRIARGLIDRASLDRYQAEHQGGRTRVWAEHTAWGAIALLSGIYPDWLGPVQASRLRSVLRTITDAGDFAGRTRDRASVRTYTGHRTALTRLRDDLVQVEPVSLGLTGASSDRVDGYLAADKLQSTVSWLGLKETPTGEASVRVTHFDLAIIRDLAVAQIPVLAALDASTSANPRERGVGERSLSVALEAYRR